MSNALGAHKLAVTKPEAAELLSMSVDSLERYVMPAELSRRLTVGTDSLATGLKTGPPLIGAFASQVACFDCPVVPTLQISVVSPSMRSSAIPLSASLPCASRVIIGNDVSANDL